MEEQAERHLSRAELGFLVDGGAAPEERPPEAEISSWVSHARACERCGTELQRLEAAEERLRAAIDQTRARLPAASGPCPEPARWERLREGMDEAEALAMIDHATDCPPCADRLAGSEFGAGEAAPPALRSSTCEWQARMGREMAKAGRNAPRHRMLVAAGIAAAIAGIAIAAALFLRRSDPDGLLAKAYADRRPFEFRLQETAYPRSGVQKGAANPFELPDSLNQAMQEIRAELRDRPNDPQALIRQARALLLLGRDEEALATLEPVREDPNAWVALACALYVGAKTRPGAEGEYARSLDLLLRARQRFGDGPVLIYDLALVYEALGQVDNAIGAWDRYLQFDGSSGFAGEARKHRDELDRARSRREGIVNAIRDGASSFLALEPAARRSAGEIFLNAAIADWLPRAAPGTAERRAVEALAREYHDATGDPFLLELKDAEPASIGQLARAMALGRKGDYLAAARVAAAAAQAFDAQASAAGALRARLEQVYAFHRATASESCLAAGEALEREARLKPYTWIAVQNQIEIAICLSHRGHLASALERSASAAAMAARAGLPSLELRARGMTADFLLRTGSVEAFWREALDCLARFWSAPHPPNYAHQIFFQMRDAAQSEGLVRASYSFARAGADLLAGWSDPLVVALNRANAAALARASGYDREAVGLDAEADWAFDKADEPGLAKRYRASALLFNATLMTESPDSARLQDVAPALDKLLRDIAPEVEQDERDDLLARLYWRARNPDAARQAAAQLMERIHRAAPAPNGRAVLARRTSAPGILAQIRLQNGAGVFEAFRVWQDLPPGESAARLSRRLGDAAYLTWAELPEGPVLWVLDDGGLDCYHPVPALPEIRARARMVRRECERAQGDPAAALRDARELFRDVLGEAAQRISTRRILVIEATGALDGLPWAAMAPPDSRIVLSFSLAEYLARAGAPGAGRDSNLVLFSSPAVSPELAALYPVLTEAANEANNVANFFGAVQRFDGPGASAASLRRAIPSAQVFHFSGHGGATEGALMLAPEAPDRPYSGLVTGEVAATLDWSHCRLAVLSACGTAPSGTSWRQSVARALLERGAARVVGSLWNVDAAATRRLMTGFYASVAAGRGAADALNSAQAELRAEPATAHPYYWAGFQMYGTL